MADLESIKRFLKNYDGPEMNIMEVCGSHTAAVAKNGIPSLLSERIRLLSGPGCPVCVTPSSYIDRLIELSGKPDVCVVTFGDLIRVPGSEGNLAEARGRGGHVKMVYSPMDILPMARKNPDTVFVFAAVGFETTAPASCLAVKKAKQEGVGKYNAMSEVHHPEAPGSGPALYQDRADNSFPFPDNRSSSHCSICEYP